jgi:large subunit ribosomal protein L29
MKAKTLREKTIEQLVIMITELKKERLSLRMQRSSGSDVKSHRFKEIRRQIAIAMTVIGEKNEGAK